MSTPVEFRVNDGTQINHGGTLYGTGETFKADPEQIQEAIVREYVTRLPVKAPRTTKDAA